MNTMKNLSIFGGFTVLAFAVLYLLTRRKSDTVFQTGNENNISLFNGNQLLNGALSGNKVDELNIPLIGARKSENKNIVTGITKSAKQNTTTL